VPKQTYAYWEQSRGVSLDHWSAFVRFLGHELRWPCRDSGHTGGGCVFSYTRYYRGVESVPLKGNYRANDTLVTFTARQSTRRVFMPFTEICRSKCSSRCPPTSNRLADPQLPAVPFVYEDAETGRLTAEADAVAA
jgi:hypothetical protein